MADQINLNQLLGGTNVLGLLDSTGALQAEAERRAQAAGLLNFAFGALQASRGAPGQGRPGLAKSRTSGCCWLSAVVLENFGRCN
jgi:hypothetical protein